MVVEPLPIPAISNWAQSQPLIRRLFLFGSYAKGTATSSSDIDLAVEIDDVVAMGEPMAQYIINRKTWQQEMERLLNRKVDLQFYSTDGSTAVEGYVEEAGTLLIFARDIGRHEKP